MLHDIEYLTKTKKTGVYGYRRRIPNDVRYLFDGKTEIVRSLKTKHLTAAQIEVERINKWFNKRVATVGYSRKSSSKLPVERLRDIYEDLKFSGDHPDDVPIIDVHTDPKEIIAFFEDGMNAGMLKKAYYDEKIPFTEYQDALRSLKLSSRTLYKIQESVAKREALKQPLERKYMDRERMRAESIDPNIDCDTEDYIVPQNKWDESDPEVIRYRMMNGENLLPPATWQNATDDYIKRFKASETPRNPEQILKHTKATMSQCIKLSAFLAHGMDTPLLQIEESDVEAFVSSTSTSPSTKTKNLSMLLSVWNGWNKCNKKSAVQSEPFKDFLDTQKSLIKATKRKRRSFTPSEYAAFQESLLNESDAEIRLIGLIMAYCGAPNGEAAKLQRRDIKLSSDVPYMVFRSTADSITGKDRLDRAVPLLEPLLTQIKDYLEVHHQDGSERIFPRHGYGTHSSSDRSALLTAHIVNERPYDPDQLSPYSLRHTFKDRAVKAKVDTAQREYLMGHKSPESSRIHEDYGTKQPVKDTVDDMQRILTVKSWGYFEEFD